MPGPSTLEGLPPKRVQENWLSSVVTPQLPLRISRFFKSGPPPNRGLVRPTPFWRAKMGEERTSYFHISSN